MLIKGGTVINENRKQKADIRIKGDRIERVAENLAALDGETVLKASSKYILPGGIDVHTHLDMPAAECSTCDDFYTGTRAAVCGGTTTVIDFAEYDQGKRMQDGLDAWHKKADHRAFCDYGFHMTVPEWKKDTRTQLASMKNQGITSFKAYTAYKDSMGVDDRQLFQIMEAVRDISGLLCVHCENGDIVEYMQEKLKAISPADIKNHPASRPNLVEKEAVSRVLDLAAMAEVPVYIVHVSTREALEVIKAAKKRGQKVYAETCPQYLLLDDSKYDLPGFEAAKYVISPPLRKKADQEALWEGLKDQTLDGISTDHCSFYFESQKTLGLLDFTRIPNGAPGVEHRLELMLHHGLNRGFSLEEMVRLLSAGPAKIFGLFPDKGVIEEGSHADIAIVESNFPHVISAGTSRQETDYTPYEGMETDWKVSDVLVKGEWIVRDGAFIGKEPKGNFLNRDKFFSAYIYA